MRRNSGITALLNLPMAELDKEIARCQMRRRTAASALLRKKFENRIRKLKSIKGKRRATKVLENNQPVFTSDN